VVRYFELYSQDAS